MQSCAKHMYSLGLPQPATCAGLQVSATHLQTVIHVAWLGGRTEGLGGLANRPEDPGVKVSALDDKSIHEEDAQQHHHAGSICNHNVACQSGDKAVQGKPKLMSQE